jgi:hypothetical protein
MSKLQHRHPILLFLHHAQVNTDQLLAISDSSPAYRWELRNGGCSDVGKEACATEDSSCGRAVLACAEAGVEAGPGFEDGGRDAVLGEEDGEEEARRSRACDDELGGELAGESRYRIRLGDYLFERWFGVASSHTAAPRAFTERGRKTERLVVKIFNRPLEGT